MARFISAVMALALWPVVATGELRELRVKGGAEPFWVAASQITAAEGLGLDAVDSSTRAAVLSAIAARKVASESESAGGPCETLTVRPYHFHRDRPYASLQDLRQYARAIYRGRITSETEGFSRGVASTLFEIEVDSVRRRDDGYPNGRTLYFEWPAADFQLRGVRFCNAPPVAGFTPSVGDEVVLFSYDPPADEARRFLSLAPEQVILLKGGKALHIERSGTGRSAVAAADEAFDRWLQSQDDSVKER